MQTHLLDHEIKMLNQIAANFAWDSDPERAASAVAAHLKRFWSPAMRAQILSAAADPELEISPLARRALDKLQAS